MEIFYIQREVCHPVSPTTIYFGPFPSREKAVSAKNILDQFRPNLISVICRVVTKAPNGVLFVFWKDWVDEFEGNLPDYARSLGEFPNWTFPEQPCIIER